MSNEIWTIKRCLDWTREYLGDKGDERPRLSAEWLLSNVTGLTRTELYMSFDKPLAQEELAAMHAAVVRRAKGEPLQYIVGQTSFRMIDVACEPGVLIPRPETELLVEEVLKFLDGEVLGAPAVARPRVELPWNSEVEAARRAEEAARAGRGEGAAWDGDGAEGNAGNAADGVVESGADAGRDASARGLGDGCARPADADGDVARAARLVPDDAAGDDTGLAAGDAAAVGETRSGDAAGCRDAVAGADGSEPAEMAPGACARVLEVGCGTGCISLSLAHERSGKVVCVATDIEPRAVALAQKNRAALGIDAKAVDIRLGNLVSPLDRETEWGTFDVLVSNPPYIPHAVMRELPHEVVDFEPSLALDGGDDGLDIFRRLVRAAPAMLRPGGLLACELFEGHVDEAAELCRTAGMVDVRVVRDLADRPRIVLARVAQAARC